MDVLADSNRRIAKNTLFLYMRMLLSILVSLYTSRVVLRVLGVDDYGIYGVVGGVVSMFTFLNAAMSGATSRFLTFEMGKGMTKRLRDIFSTALIIHIGIALVIFIIAESVGLWFLNNKLVIPEGRMFAANIVYQCSIVSMFFNITQVPYSAVIVSHEKMDIYAYVELFSVCLRLAIVFLLMIGSFDKLILYAILSVCVNIVITLTYRLYCIRHYDESHFRKVWDKQLVKPMLNFSGWNMIAECGYSFRVYGSNIVLNMFFGTAVNAAAGVASTIQGILIGLVGNTVTAVRPQIIKNYSLDKLQRMNRLVLSSIRINLLLVAIVTVPVFVDAPFVLNLWLDSVPEYSVQFCRLLLFAIYITIVSQIVTICIHATGNIKQTSIVRNIIYLSTPFIIYFVLRYHSSNPIVGYFIIVINQMVVCLTDILILHKEIPQLSCNSIFGDYIKSLLVASCIAALVYIVNRNNITFINFVLHCIVEWALLLAVFYFMIFKENERNFIFSVSNSVFKKMFLK